MCQIDNNTFKRDQIDTGRNFKVDKCLLPLLRHLWDKNIETVICCCGHFSHLPYVDLKSHKDLTKLLSILKNKTPLVIESIEHSPAIEGTWRINFNGLVCTPTIIPYQYHIDEYSDIDDAEEHFWTVVNEVRQIIVPDKYCESFISML